MRPWAPLWARPVGQKIGRGQASAEAEEQPTDEIQGSVSQGATFTHEADFRLVFTVDTLPASSSINVRFRRQDSTHYMGITIAADGQLDIVQQNGLSNSVIEPGSPGDVSAGDEIEVAAAGTEIDVSVNGVALHEKADSMFTSATAGLVNSLGTGGEISDLATYPAA